VGTRAGWTRVPWPVFLFLTGCGYVGDPLPPLRNIPGPIADVAAVQRGGRLIVQFTPPTLTTEGLPVPTPLRIDLRVGTAVDPFTPEAWASQAKQIPEVEVKDGMARYEIPSAEWAGKEVTIGARTVGPNRKDSGWSNLVNLEVVPAPERPAVAPPEATPKGVRLTWKGGAGRYHVFRRAGDEKEYQLAASPEQPEWVDEGAETGKTYTYLVQKIVPAGAKTAESELSEPATITVKDTFPPAAPTGLRGVGGTTSIELTWERNREADLAGYRIYRAVGDGPFEKAGEAALPAYSDRAVEAGKAYRYRVTAVDASGNESERSGEVAVTI
jgi:fibronectin type 3 domain-containing protein